MSSPLLLAMDFIASLSSLGTTVRGCAVGMKQAKGLCASIPDICSSCFYICVIASLLLAILLVASNLLSLVTPPLVFRCA